MDDWENPIWAALQAARGHKPEDDTAPMPAYGDVPGDKEVLKIRNAMMATNPAAALGRTAIMEGGKALWDVYGGHDKLEGAKSAMRDYISPPSYMTAPLRGGYAEGGEVENDLPLMAREHPDLEIADAMRLAKDYPTNDVWALPGEAPIVGVEGAPDVGAGRRDAIYSALGLRQLPTLDSRGMYRNMAQEWESNPAKLARPLVDFPTQAGLEKGMEGSVAPLTEQAMKAAERFRGVNDAQEAFTYNMPNTMAAAKGKTGVLLDTVPHGSYTGNQADADILAALNTAAERHGYGVTSTNRGVLAFPYGEGTTAGRKKVERELGAIMPEATPIAARPNTGYGPAIGKWGEEGVIPSTPYTGEATIGALEEFVGLPHEVAQNLSESEAVRKAIRAKIARDEMVGGTRGDIQNTRRFFAEANWPAVVDLMRKGMSPAAALAALGYSASALAGERSGAPRGP